MARVRVKKGLAEITTNDTHKAFTVGSIDGYNESWDEAGLRKHARMSLEAADYLRELTAKGYKEDYKKAYLNDSITEYKGYSIEKDFYGKGEYTVQYQGDDVVFKSVEEAKEFINEISDSFKDAEYPKGVHNRSTLYGEYHNGTIWYDGDGFYALNGSGKTKWFPTIEEAYVFVGYVKDSAGMKDISTSDLNRIKQIAHKCGFYVNASNYNSVVLHQSSSWNTSLPKLKDELAKQGYKIIDDGINFAVVAVKDSKNVFKVTDKRTGKVHLVSATDSLEAIGKVVNNSNLGGKR